MTAEPPAVTKMLGLFERLRQAEINHQPVTFQLSQQEVNDYLSHSLQITPRPGLRSLTVKFFTGNYISTYTTVDFDAVEKWKPGTIPTLLKPVLSGNRSIWLDVRVNPRQGFATYSIEKAYFQDVRLPALLVQKVIAMVAARQPEHYDTNKPIPLPFGLKTIWTGSSTVAGQN